MTLDRGMGECAPFYFSHGEKVRKESPKLVTLHVSLLCVLRVRGRFSTCCSSLSIHLLELKFWEVVP